MLETLKMAEIATEKRIPHGDRKESAYRRSNKPLMEKKRRARINSCLTQLKTLVLQAMRKDTNQYSKLEKADILEMTVKHLRQLQRQHVTNAISHDPTVATKYRAGFNECANEVVRYLGSIHSVDTEVRSRLLNHLGNVVTTVNTCSQEQQPQPQQQQQQQPTMSQPLNVQIPQHLNGNVASVPTGCLLMAAGVPAPSMVVQSPVSTATQQGQTQPISPVHHHHRQQQQQQQQHHHQQQQQHHNHASQQSAPEFCGQFQIIPHSAAPGAVAVYLGQTSSPTPSPSAGENAVPLYSTHTPPRTKASMKAFDSSAFSQVQNQQQQTQVDKDSSSLSPSDSIKSLREHSDYQINGIHVGCGRTPSPLKMESVWRPW